jgi:hypothetical protein
MTEIAGAFELTEPVPELNKPRLVMALSPWIDVGAVGSGALDFLEKAWDAQPLAHLSRPGDFFDFTRYRPTLRRIDGVRQIDLPNTYIRHAKDPSGADWIFMHGLEPHNRAEDYLESIMAVTERFGVAENMLIGSFYGPMPHTRPPMAYGEASDEAALQKLRNFGAQSSAYEGPTTVFALATEQAYTKGIETTRIILQLPAYAQLEQDYRGLKAMLELMADFYGLSLDLSSVDDEATRQTAMINEAVEGDARLQRWVEEAAESTGEPVPPLSPELEDFLREAQRPMDDQESP